MSFPHERDWSSVDCREDPAAYEIGRGEQGVLSIEPYKSELLPLWRFRTPAVAMESVAALEGKYAEYRRDGDFPGMDMTRKFIQMGFTRARRYANHRSGRKYAPGDPRDGSKRSELPKDGDPEKAESARIFKEAWDRIRADPEYARMKDAWRQRYGSG